MERLTDEQINKFADDRLWGGSKDPARAIRQLQADNARLREALTESNRQLGGGCDANDGGDHLVITQGKYQFCGKCGESLKGVRFVHLPRATEGES